MLFKNSVSSIERSLSKVTIIYQATGIQFFSVNVQSLASDSGLSRKHKLFMAFNFVILMCEFYAVIFTIQTQNVKHQHSGIATGQIVQFTAYSLISFVIAICMLNSFFHRGKAKEIFNNCYKISEILSHLNHGVDYSSFENEFKMTVVKLFSSFSIMMTAFLIFIYKSNNMTFFLSATAVIYPYFFMIINFSYWTLLVRLIRENLRFVKKCLEHLRRKRKLFRINAEAYNHDLRMRRIEETYNFIAKLKRVYSIIYNSTSLVNELIGIPICVFMALIILSNISAGYRVFLSFRGDVAIGRIASK